MGKGIADEAWKRFAQDNWFDETGRRRTWPEMEELLRPFLPDMTEEKRKQTVRWHLRNTDKYEPLKRADAPKAERGLNEAALLSLLKRGTSIRELVDRGQTTEEEVIEQLSELDKRGFVIDMGGKEVKLSKVPHAEAERVDMAWKGNKVVRFGLLSDTHINSKCTQLTLLNQAYDTYASEGISIVYHAGDIDDGEKMHPGQEYECYEQGADDHVTEIVRVYPCRPGIETVFITGNHDHSLIKRSGYDIGKTISRERPDMHYVGQSQAYIALTPNCTMELRHPGDGSAYAISYKTQKIIEAMSGGEKPNILGIGHYHKQETIFYRNVHALQAATTCAQTPWMRGKGIAAAMGYWLVEAVVGDEGYIKQLRPVFFPCYKAIPEDYKNWR